jgi:hypothetical protein
LIFEEKTMSQTIESLWPHQIRERVLSPIAILRAQGEALARQTGGILLGEIKKEVADEAVVSLAFNIVVPALDNYRHRVVDVLYANDSPYPAIVDAEVTRPDSSTLIRGLTESGRVSLSSFYDNAKANNDHELIALLEKVFKSPAIVSAAQSLLARASDVLNEESYPPDGRTTSGEYPSTIADHEVETAGNDEETP